MISETQKEAYKNDQAILNDFYKAIESQDEYMAGLHMRAIRSMARCEFEGGHTSRPWKASDLENRVLMMTETNEKMHPYLAEFFDVAFRENASLEGMYSALYNSIRNGSGHIGTNCGFQYDGNYEIGHWLQEYAKTALAFQEQGKEIIEPKTFEQYPELRQFVKDEIELIKYDRLAEKVDCWEEDKKVEPKDLEAISFTRDDPFYHHKKGILANHCITFDEGQDLEYVEKPRIIPENRARTRERKRKEEEERIKKLLKDIPYMSDEEQQKVLEHDGEKKEVVKALLCAGAKIPQKTLKIFNPEELSDIRMSKRNMALLKHNEEEAAKNEKQRAENDAQRAQNEASYKRIEEAREAIAKKERQLAYDQSIIDSERQSSVNAKDDLKNLTDAQRKKNFDAKRKLMEEHPIMLEACLNSMCTSYYLTEDKKLKKEMLTDLYSIRKGGAKKKDNREMSKTFKRVLDRNPELAKDENLVALSKNDTPFAQPTKRVKKLVTNDKESR